ncbi:MAG: hypothetical protein WCJ30_28090 [Deltaproteobacteria bacterium]
MLNAMLEAVRAPLSLYIEEQRRVRILIRHDPTSRLAPRVIEGTPVGRALYSPHATLAECFISAAADASRIEIEGEFRDGLQTVRFDPAAGPPDDLVSAALSRHAGPCSHDLP